MENKKVANINGKYFSIDDIEEIKELPKQIYMFIPALGTLLFIIWMQKKLTERNAIFIKYAICNRNMFWDRKKVMKVFIVFFSITISLATIFGIIYYLEFYFGVANVTLGGEPLYMITQGVAFGFLGIQVLGMWLNLIIIIYYIRKIKNHSYVLDTTIVDNRK